MQLSLLLPLCLSAQPEEPREYDAEVLEGVELLAESYQRLLEVYAVDLDPVELAEAGVRGMVSTLEKHTDYVSPEENRLLPTERPAISLGLQLFPAENHHVVVAITPEGPAERAGVRLGDRVVTIDGEVGVEQLVTGGLVGEVAEVEIVRGEEEMSLSVVRERLTRPLMEPIVRFEDSLLYVRIDRFSEGLGSFFRGEMLRAARYEARERPVVGMVLDLRGNGGGLVDEAVEVADHLLPPGSPIGQTGSRLSDEEESYFSKEREVVPGLPLLVLVDRKTASAAEILAVALQENRRAILLGERTLGKGVTQETEHLRNGGHLRITSAWNLTPTGRSIDRGGADGIPPDSIVAEGGIVPDSVVNDPGLRLLRELREEYLPLRFVATYQGDRNDPGVVNAFIIYALERDQWLTSTLNQLEVLRVESGVELAESGAWGLLAGDIEGRREAAYLRHRDLLGRELREQFLDLERSGEERVRAWRERDELLRRGRELLKGIER